MRKRQTKKDWKKSRNPFLKPTIISHTDQHNIQNVQKLKEKTKKSQAEEIIE